MKDFFLSWNFFLDKLKKYEHLLLFLDYDGTLTPIVKKPELAKLPPRRKIILQKLSKKRYLKVAIISGRALHDIKKIVGRGNIVFAGNHGMELSGPRIRFQDKGAVQIRRLIAQFYVKLCKVSKDLKAVFIENKGLTLSVHFRAVKNRKIIKRLNKSIDDILCLKIYKRSLKKGYGKKVFEIRPKGGNNKGKIVRWLLKKTNQNTNTVLPVYIGDDTTDEDAFRTLLNKGITIFVGKPKKASYAQFYLKGTNQVYRFLRRLLKIKTLG